MKNTPVPRKEANMLGTILCVRVFLQFDGTANIDVNNCEIIIFRLGHAMALHEVTLWYTRVFLLGLNNLHGVVFKVVVDLASTDTKIFEVRVMHRFHEVCIET